MANGPVEVFVNEQLPEGVADEFGDGQPGGFALRAGPNPLRGALALTLQSTQPATLQRIDLLDCAGRRVAHCSAPPAGAHRVHAVVLESDGDGAFSAGVYLLRVQARDGRGRACEAEERLVWLGL